MGSLVRVDLIKVGTAESSVFRMNSLVDDDSENVVMLVLISTTGLYCSNLNFCKSLFPL